MSELSWMLVPYTDIPFVAVLFLIGRWFLLRNRATPLESSAERQPGLPSRAKIVALASAP